MRLRLTGTREECEDLSAVLPDLLGEIACVREVSGFYPNRGTSALGRIYLEITPAGDAAADGRSPHGTRPVQGVTR
jgi:hypothetical protein